jgi:threonine dehydratase
VPCGGAGLLSGAPSPRTIFRPASASSGVEPEAGDDAARSLRTRTLQRVENPRPSRRGAHRRSSATITFPLVLEHVRDIITVSDAQLVEAMRFLWERMKLVVEPTGALAAAGILSGPVDVRNRRVGIILSGGNVDLKAAAALFA